MAEGTPDQEIIIKYTVDADAALVRNAEMEQAIETVKKQLLDLASQSNTSLRTMADSMKSAFAEMRTAQANAEAAPLKMAVGQPGAKADIKKIMDEASADIARYNATINEALKRSTEEISAVTKEGAQARIASEKNVTDAQKSEIAKQKAEKQTQAILEQGILAKTVSAQNEYIMKWTQGNKQMSAGAQAFGKDVQDMKTQIVQASQQSGQSITQIATAFKAAGQPVAVVNQAVRELNATMQQTAGAGSGVVSFFSNLGSIGKYVFGAVLGISAVTVLRDIVNWFKAAVQAGEEFAMALVKLEVGVRALQKAGMAITFAEVTKQIQDLRRTFSIFTTKEIVEGIGQVSLLTQNLNLTREQLGNVTKVTTALAVIMGKDFNEAARSIALFMSSGYGEALQKAGILASRMSVQQELLNMGIKGGYMQATDAQRALAAYNVIMQQSGTIVSEAERVQGEYIFKIRETQTAWEDIKNTIGIRTIPTFAILSSAVTGFLKHVNDFVGLVGLAITQMEKQVIDLAVQWKLLIAFMERKITFKEMIQGIIELKSALSDTGQVTKDLMRQNFPDLFTGMEDAATDAARKLKEYNQAVETAALDLHDRITSENKKFADDMAKIELDLQRDLEKIDRDGAFRREALFTDFIRAVEKINASLAEDIYNENLKYTASVADAQRDYANRRADIEAKYRERELKAQKDFEEKMRRLREDFIMDMEDALRERDARQVLRLIRQFNLNKARLEREAQSDKEERQREHRRELQDLEKQRDERLRQLAEEHAARIAALQRQAQIERVAAWAKYQQELADLQLSLQRQKEERQIQYDQQKTDLENQHKERLQQITDALIAEYTVTGKMLEDIMALYRAKFGPGGELEAIYRYAASVIQGFYAALGTYANTPGYGGVTPEILRTPSHNYATGGSFLATSPTIAQFGEVPEKVTAVPVNQMTKMASIHGSGSKNGTITIEMLLSPDLEARVIDKALDMSADIILDIQRRN